MKKRKSPSVKDYGGLAYGIRRRRTKLAKENVFSFRCLDCGAVRYVVPRELGRATMPRCLRCGGFLEDTQASRQRRIAKADTLRIARGEAGPAGLAETGVRCKSCGAKFRGTSFLALHLTQAAECLHHYWENLPVVIVKGLSVIKDSVHVERRGASNWHLRGVTRSGGLAEIIRRRTKRECERDMAQGVSRPPTEA